MRRLVVNEFVSLDGVAQAPGLADEDTSGGFAHGGWDMPYMEDELAQQWVLGSNEGARRPLRLVGSQAAGTGAILATYAPTG